MMTPKANRPQEAAQETAVPLFQIGNLLDVQFGQERKAAFSAGHNYKLTLDGVDAKRTAGVGGRPPANILIFEFSVLESDDPMLPPGSEAKWVVAPETDVGHKNLGLFFLAASGFKRAQAASEEAKAQLAGAQNIIFTSVDATAKVNLGAITREDAFSNDSSLLGSAVALQTKSAQTKPNHRGESFPFTMHAWAPYNDDAAAPF